MLYSMLSPNPIKRALPGKPAKEHELDPISHAWAAPHNSLFPRITLSGTLGDMREGPPPPERLAAFSDGVMAVIITIMVLDLKPPHDATWHALVPLWPTFFSYALSYLFVGVFWSNHHYMLRDAHVADHKLVAANLFSLFTISLIPFCTAYLAENRMQRFPTALYAGLFLLATFAYLILQRIIDSQNESDPEAQRKKRATGKRDWLSTILFTLAVPAAYLHPALSFILILAGVLFYFLPNTLWGL